MNARARLMVVSGLLAMMISSLLLPAMAIAKDPGARGLAVSAPPTAVVGELVTLTVDLPADVAAIDGRVVVRNGAADIVGVAPLGDGTAFRPEAISEGFAIGAFGLTPQGANSTVQVVVEPLRPGRLHLRLVIDTVADAKGNRIDLQATVGVATIRVSGGDESFSVPELNRRPAPNRAPREARELVADGRFDRQDLDVARGGWLTARATGDTCDAGASGDANGDGCVDIADVQALDALLPEPDQTPATGLSTLLVAAAFVHTFVVTSTADTADASPGNGTCADSQGRCTLRAAMTESNYLAGEDLIQFNLAGTAPVTIQLNSRLPDVTARNGGLTIDGYTQPGATPNTASFGSNAVPGVEIRGNGLAAREMGFYITSPGNTVRGLVLGNLWRPIVVDGVDAHDNRIIGNWIGFTRTGGNSSSGQFGIVMNAGSHNNVTGTPDLADRNVIGNFQAGMDNYGPGSNANVTQNNLFCIRPNGLTATCSIGIDHNFGPKDGLIGGTGLNEANVIGPTTLQGIEYSHGWNPADHSDDPTYQINNNRAIGNWVGFRADGSYSATYRSGLDFSGADNAQGINVYDGTNDNVIEANYVASVYDGIQVMSPNAKRNSIRNNIIGRSPQGQAAPLTGWGVVIRWSSTFDVVEGNIIQNATKGGIGLLNTNNNGGGLAPAFNIRLTRNIVTATNGPAIDLFGIAGPDPNDPGDGDMGANTLLNRPIITVATTTTIGGTAASGATVEVFRASRAVGSFGLPTEFLASTVAAPNGQWSLSRASVLGDVITALQIQPDQNTSELAANVAVGANPPQAPAFTSANNAAFVAGSFGTFSVTTVGTPTAAITQAGALPAGVTFTNNGNGTGTLAGTVAVGSTGSYPITFTATNGVPPNATQNFTLTINQPPAFTSANNAAFVAGSFGTFSVTTVGTPTAAITQAGALPAGVTFTNNGNGTGTLAGTVAVGSTGSYPITFTATNGVPPNATQNFTLTINEPPLGAPIAEDSFNRTVNNNWGSATTGGAYTLTGTAADFDVTGDVGTMTLGTSGTSRTAALASVSAQNVDLSFRVATNKTPTGSHQFIYGVARRVSAATSYRIVLRIATNGQVVVGASSVINNAETPIGAAVVVPGLTHTPGSFIRLRAQLTGTTPTTIRIRAWADGGTEPSTWQYTATNSAAQLQAAGGVGLQSYLTSATTNAPVVVTFDDFLVTSIP